MANNNPFKPVGADSRSDLSGNTDFPEIAGYSVLDIILKPWSIYGRLNGWGIWPSRKTLQGLSCGRVEHIRQIAHWRRYVLRGNVVYRLYLIKDTSIVENNWPRAIAGGAVHYEEA